MGFFNRFSPLPKEASEDRQYSQEVVRGDALIHEFMDVETREAIERNGGSVWVSDLEKGEIQVQFPDDATEGKRGAGTSVYLPDGTGIHITNSGHVYMSDKGVRKW